MSEPHTGRKRFEICKSHMLLMLCPASPGVVSSELERLSSNDEFELDLW